MPPIVIPASDLLSIPSREFILLAGKDGVGKTCAILSLAEFASQMTPEATFYLIDTENKVRVTLQSWGSVPPNLRYYPCTDMNDVTEAAAEVLGQYKPGDWLGIESMARIWERAQDLGYQAVTGTMKAAYMERRRGNKSLPVTPQPDQLWSIIKSAHDAELLDKLSNLNDLNVVISTTVSRPKAERANRKESQERVDFRAETGVDMNLDGAPRLATYVFTGCLLALDGGNVQCRVWRDNRSPLEDPRVTFAVENKKSFATDFYVATGR